MLANPANQAFTRTFRVCSSSVLNQGSPLDKKDLFLPTQGLTRKQSPHLGSCDTITTFTPRNSIRDIAVKSSQLSPLDEERSLYAAHSSCSPPPNVLASGDLLVDVGHVLMVSINVVI